MNHKIQKIWLITVLLLTTFASHSAELNILVGLEKPPYIIEKNQTGYELDLIRQLAALQQHGVNITHVSQKRLEKEMNSGRYDAVLMAKTAQNQQLFQWSVPMNCYQNELFVRPAVLLPLAPEQLKKMRIFAFSGASQVLGSQISDWVQFSKSYREVIDQAAQVKALFQHQADAILLDSRIFQYYRQQLGITASYQSSPVNNSVCYAIATHSAELAQRLTRSYLQLVENKTIEKLQQHYFSDAAQLQPNPRPNTNLDLPQIRSNTDTLRSELHFAPEPVS